MSNPDLIRKLSLAIVNGEPIEFIASDAIAVDAESMVVIGPSTIRATWLILIAPGSINRLLELIPDAKDARPVVVADGARPFEAPGKEELHL